MKKLERLQSAEWRKDWTLAKAYPREFVELWVTYVFQRVRDALTWRMGQ